MEPLVIEIPVIVGSNGKWCANGYTATAKDGADWGFMADALEGDDGNYPNTEKRYVVRATVFVPDETPEVVTGATLEAAT